MAVSDYIYWSWDDHHKKESERIGRLITIIKQAVDFSIVAMEDITQWITIFKMLWKKPHKLRIPHVAKLSFKNEEKIKISSSKNK